MKTGSAPKATIPSELLTLQHKAHCPSVSTCWDTPSTFPSSNLEGMASGPARQVQTVSPPLNNICCHNPLVLLMNQIGIMDNG